MSFILLTFVTALLAVLTVLPLWSHEAWWIRGMDFPRLQLIGLLILQLIAILLHLDPAMTGTWVLAAVSAACLSWQCWWILPYTKLARPEVKATSALKKRKKDSIRILIANVLTSNRRADLLLDLVRRQGPDILVTLESDIWWQRQLDVLEATHPWALKCPLDNTYGMHVYSRLRLENCSIRFLVEPDIPSMHVRAVLDSGIRTRLHFLHPVPPSPAENEASSERDAELLVAGRMIRDTELPVILTGDLNDVAWSDTTRLFRKISGLLDPRIGRGMYNTYHAEYRFLRWPLDYIFHSHEFTLSLLERLPPFGSDHFAIAVELLYEPGRNESGRGPEATAEDEARSREKIRSQNVGSADVDLP